MVLEISYRDYLYKLTIGFTLISLLLGLTIETVYKDLFSSLVKLALSEEYSYILVALFSTLFVIYLSLRYTGFSYGLRVSKILASILLALLSLSVYQLSIIDLEYKVQLQTLSFALFFIALIILVYEPITLGEVIPILTPLLLTPLPASFLDSITPVLSRYIGRFVGLITGVRVVESPGFTQLEVVTPTGETALLSIEAACTGIVTVSSLIATAPLIIYMLTFSVDKPVRKAVVSATAVATSLFIGILGNVIRVLIVVYTAKWSGVEQAYNFFHYSPSLIYSTLSVAVAFKIVEKHARFRKAFSRILIKQVGEGATWNYVLGVFAVSFIFTSLFTTAAVHAVQAPPPGQSVITGPGGLEDFIENPEKYLTTGDIVFTSKQYDSFLTRVLGALVVYRVGIRSSNEYYTGYVEIVDTPARLHTWQLCLTLQGYNILASWAEEVNNTRVVFITLEKQGWKGVLAYTLFSIPIVIGNAETTIYIRVSAIKAGEPDTLVPGLSTLLNNLAASVKSYSNQYVGLDFITISSISTYLILAILITYAIAVFLISRMRRTHGGIG
uniref:Exosortase/archaeosortase family protein n=1 Tax=Thermosphaera aggregans TaxID=54254 RepID=A0A7C2BL85_9CREN